MEWPQTKQPKMERAKMASEHDTQYENAPDEAMRFTASVQFVAADAAKPGVHPVKMIARTKGVMSHWYWGTAIHDMAGMRVHKAKIPIDYEHGEEIGYVDKWDTKSGDLVLSGALVPTDQPGDLADRLIQRARGGVPYEASINWHDWNTLVIEDVPGGATAEVNGYTVQGPVTIFRQWSLRGVAICPYGADKNTVSKFSKRQTKEGDMPPKDVKQDAATKPSDAEAGAGTDVKDQGQAKAAEKGSQEAAATASTTAGEAPAATVPEGRKECQRFVQAFGATDGANWYVQGLSFEEANAKFTQKLREENETMKQKMAATSAAAGEAEPVAPSGGDKQGGEKKKGLASAVKIAGR